MPFVIKTVWHDIQPGRFVEVEGLAGTHLLTMLEEAILVAQRLECGICWEFNGVSMWAYPHSDAEQLFQYFIKKL